MADYQVSIIIVNYNTKTLLRSCIHSIYEQTANLSYEIIVVDNASSDGSVELVTKEFPDVRLIVSPVNLGFGKANNKGVTESRGENIFFLNSDTILLNNAISILHEFLCHNQTAAICGGNLYDKDMQPVHSFYRFPTIKDEFRALFFPKRNIPYHNFMNHVQKVEYITGADMMIRKEIFTKAGAFDSDFFMYYEETELTWHITQMGYQVFSVPEAKIIHYQGMSSTKKKQPINSQYLLSKFIYFQKIYGRHRPIYIKKIHMAKCNMSLLVHYIFRNKNKIEYWTLKRKIIHETFQKYLNTFVSI